MNHGHDNKDSSQLYNVITKQTPPNQSIMALSQSLPQNYTSNLLAAVPRLAKRAGAFAIHYLPDNFDAFLGKLLVTGSSIADPTFTSNLSTPPITGTSTAAAFLSSLTANATDSASPVPDSGSFIPMFSLSNLRRLTSFGSYVLSKWALATMIVAFALNRTQVYASVRVPLRLNWVMRTALYLIPISLLLFQIETILRALRCQSSPNWSDMRYGNASMNYALDHAGDGGALYDLTTSLLRWETDVESCQASSMAALLPGEKHYGSLSLLWPLFLSFCTSSFVETLIAALQGRQPIIENSLFEQSLSFAEAEALVVRPFELAVLAHDIDLDAGLPLKVSQVKRVMNVTQEVLLISLISALFNLTCNILAIFGKRKKWRFVNTAVWGFANMIAFSWGIYRIFAEETYDDWTFRFPTVFVIGFIPHVLIISGILCCGFIYSLALLLMTISAPPGPTSITLKERFSRAYDNLQANFYLRTGENIRFSWEDDFYSTLLKVGFSVLTCASEAVYLNESTNVSVSESTWLERKRLTDLTNHHSLLYKKTREAIPNEIKRRAATGHATVDHPDQALVSESGYSIERKPKSRDRNTETAVLENTGTGVAQHHGRWHLAIRFMRGLLWLSLAASLQTFFTISRTLGIRWRPRWVDRLIGPNLGPTKTTQRQPQELGTPKFYMFSEDGRFKAAKDPNVDVESEFRRQHRLGVLKPALPNTNTETEIDSRLYDWWKRGGWWGDEDASGEYINDTPLDDDNDDLTSVLSTTETADDWQTESESEADNGQTTPTRSNPHPFSANAAVPEDLLDPSLLANLLDPQTVEHHAEARMLARHLRSSGILTRSSYARSVARDNAALLTSSRFSRQRKALDEVEEESSLETLILEQRARHVRPPPKVSAGDGRAGDAAEEEEEEDWAHGAPGLGKNGPLCVVCQDAPRTVLLWPCGCLALCDECRVIMATRSFTSCVCCRTGTEAFSRLFVP
jgi:hypothetical protein